MGGGALPPALLCAAMGLLLAYGPRRLIVPCFVAVVVTAALVVPFAIPPAQHTAAFLGCWASIVATALLLHLSRAPSSALLIGLALNAGLWVGAVIAVSDRPTDLALALPWALIVFPARLILKTPLRLGVKIVGSWLAAVAILAAALPLVPTPGYEPDHRQ